VLLYMMGLVMRKKIGKRRIRKKKKTESSGRVKGKGREAKVGQRRRAIPFFGRDNESRGCDRSSPRQGG
jgi:hypothetical protein